MTMMKRDLEPLTRLLRAELTAVHQQFFHMLALRQLKDDEMLTRVTKIDTEDFKNAMQIIDLLVSWGLPISLGPHRVFPGSDTASILRAECQMEERMADVLSEIEVADPKALACVRRAAAPRREYRVWLEGRVEVSDSTDTRGETGEVMAGLLAHLIALVEQPMLHAFLLWHRGNRTGADNAWRLSGAAMLYGTALIRRGALSGDVPTPGSIPAVRMAAKPSAAFDADMELVRRCAVLARDAAGGEPDEATARLCGRIADDCRLIAGMEIDREFPAVFGRSQVFESFAATRDKHLS